MKKLQLKKEVVATLKHTQVGWVAGGDRDFIVLTEERGCNVSGNPSCGCYETDINASCTCPTTPPTALPYETRPTALESAKVCLDTTVHDPNPPSLETKCVVTFH